MKVEIGLGLAPRPMCLAVCHYDSLILFGEHKTL